MKRVWILAFVLSASTGIAWAAQQAVEPQALSIGLVLDTSGSMGPKMGLARQVLSQLINDANPQEEIALIEASDHPVVLSGFGSDADTLLAYAVPREARGGSALIDAIYLGTQLTRTGRNERKVLLLISDGGDNSSRYSKTEIEAAIRETGVRVFVIALGGPSPISGQSAQELAGSELLTQIAAEAGGRRFGIQSASDLPHIATELGSAMRASVP